MANVRERILRELKIQEGIEGKSSSIEMVRKFLTCVHSQNSFNTFINVKWHRYGIKSYESHRFYYPTSLLLKIIKEFKDYPISDVEEELEKIKTNESTSNTQTTS